MKTEKKSNLATFGGGCFWGVEDAFTHISGVIKTTVGYTGGTLKNPTYEQVCSDRTGFVEVVHIQFDEKKVSYKKLLDLFWSIHNPTTENRQGPDIGSQYRSVIFFHTKEQEKIAQESKKELEKSGKYDKPIVTAIEKAQTFYPAEEYHQKYYQKKGIKSCHL